MITIFISLICGIYRINSQTKLKQTQTQSGLVVARGEGEGGTR